MEFLFLNFDSRITDAGLKHLEQFSDLKVLVLQGTAITDAGMSSLAKLQNLEELYGKMKNWERYYREHPADRTPKPSVNWMTPPKTTPEGVGSPSTTPEKELRPMVELLLKKLEGLTLAQTKMAEEMKRMNFTINVVSITLGFKFTPRLKQKFQNKRD